MANLCSQTQFQRISNFFLLECGSANDDYMSQVQCFSIQREVQLRFLSPADIPEVKKLCSEWFPIEYPDVWYQEITSNPKFYSLAATYHSRIIGLIVCEVKQKARLNKEDADILAPSFNGSIQVAYILSLGVVVDFRKHGIASLLLDNLLSFLTTNEHVDCKAAYLHVLSTNNTAIHFYERRNFSAHSYLPYYYSINGKPRDGYSYVRYINGGRPPWSLFDYVSHCGAVVTKLQPCALPRQIMRTVRRCFCRLLSTGNPDPNTNYSY